MLIPKRVSLRLKLSLLLQKARIDARDADEAEKEKGIKATKLANSRSELCGTLGTVWVREMVNSLKFGSNSTGIDTK